MNGPFVPEVKTHARTPLIAGMPFELCAVFRAAGLAAF
jgi:hypothetical protein